MSPDVSPMSVAAISVGETQNISANPSEIDCFSQKAAASTLNNIDPRKRASIYTAGEIDG